MQVLHIPMELDRTGGGSATVDDDLLLTFAQFSYCLYLVVVSGSLIYKEKRSCSVTIVKHSIKNG